MTRCAVSEDLARWMAAQDAQDVPDPWDADREAAEDAAHCAKVAAELRAAGWWTLADEVAECGDWRRADEAVAFVGGAL